MPNNNIKKVNLTSSNLSEEKLQELRRIMPEVFSETKIDWELLKSVLGENIDPRIEKFGFTWAGKNRAIQNVITPSTATLRPSKEESVDFDKSENLFIEGDNLEVLKLLQKAYFEKVKMIYIDPPYNTGTDFVYKDDFKSPVKSYLEQTGQLNNEGQKLQTNSETSGRYHSDWLSMMYPRIKLGWNLLKEDGVIYVSIDDGEAHHLRMVMDEIFGEENFLGQFLWKSRQTTDSRKMSRISIDHEYVIAYAKNAMSFGVKGVAIDESKYTNPDNDPRGPWASIDLSVQATKDQRPNQFYDIVDPSNGNSFPANPNRVWSKSKKVVDQMIAEGRIIFPSNTTGKPRERKFLADLKSGLTGFSSWLDSKDVGYTTNGTKELSSIFESRIFDFPKPTSLLKAFIAQSTGEGDTILDFFAGSGTTAHAVMKLNDEDGIKRKWICVQLPEKLDKDSEGFKAGYKTIADITKDRIRRVISGYGDNAQPLDDGFKVFTLGESNYPENTFDFDPEKSEEENESAFELYLTKAKQNSLFDDENGIDVVYENIIKEGFSLNSKVEEVELGKNTIYIVTDDERTLHLCLDRKINSETVNKLTTPEYKNRIFICLDKALDDTAKANLGLNLELKTI